MIILLMLLPISVPLTYLIFYYYRRWSKAGKLIDLIPGPPTIPLFGNILSFQVGTERLFTIVREMNREFYPLYRIWSFQTPVINICHPDDAEVLLSSTRHIEKSFIYNLLHPWFHTGLLTSTGSKWQTRRKILTPAFHFNVLQQFVDIFVEEGERLTASLKSQGGEVVKNLMPLISEHTLNAICETAMGTTLQGRGAFQYKYREAVHRMGQVLVHRLVRPWVHNDFIFSLTEKGKAQTSALKILHGFTKKIIRERKQYHDETGERYLRDFSDTDGLKDELKEGATMDDIVPGIRKKRLAMLDLLIAASRDGNQIDDSGIGEEVDTFMFEGHDTTAMGMCFCLLLLAENEEVQECARREVGDTLAAHSGKMSISMLQKLSYLERCIKESLRLYPSVPFISRQINEEMHLKNYVVPVGTTAHVHIYDIHRDPNFWPEPNKFNPDRFLPEHAHGRHPYSYIPFSAGPRNCIGQRFAMLELKAILSHILHNFYLKPVDRLADVVMLSDLVLRPSHPIRIKFVPRDNLICDPIK